jgi:cellulose biosynthesis protein BcsQ
MEIPGLKELTEQINNIKDIKPGKPLLAGAYTLQKFSMENAPVRTGFLRNSHESSETEDGAEMRVTANYAFSVEFGNSKWEGKPYVRPAIDEHSKDILEAIKEELEKEIKKTI